MTRRSRRSVLAACGAGTAALAGCSVDVGGGGNDEREYDAGALGDRFEGREVPTRPDTFPVAVGDPLVDRHYDRARERLAAVPERPDVPNGAVSRELWDRRGRVVEDIEEPSDAATGPWRLATARRVRREAAEVEGAYRAAVGAVDPGAVVERRGSLRADLHAFEADRDYRGTDRAGALVVHAELENLGGSVRRNAEAWPPFPDDPAADVFGTGEVLGRLEAARAALSDADRLRARYLDGATDPRSYRSAITAAAHRLDRRVSFARRRVDEYLGLGATELPFERSVEGTPAARLYQEARGSVELLAGDADRARRAGDHATATLESATELAGLETFEAVVEGVEAGKYGPPEDAAGVATARDEAVAALQEAWETDPTPVSVEVAEPAHRELSGGHRRLERTDGYAREVDDAFASFAYAEQYAALVPDVVGTVTDALGGGG